MSDPPIFSTTVLFLGDATRAELETLDLGSIRNIDFSLLLLCSSVDG
jgi:hypothetical protein